MDTFTCAEIEEDFQDDTVQECEYALCSFDSTDQQETLEREIIQQNNEHESIHEISMDYEEENFESVQQKLQMKSKLAIENVIKSNITVDLLQHKIEDEKTKINVLDEKIILLIDEREHLKNAEFIQNAKYGQLTTELENIRNIINIFNKHNTEDDEGQTNMQNKLTVQEDLFEKFKNEGNAIFQKLEEIEQNAEKYKSLIETKEATSKEYKERIQSMETVLGDIQDEIKENDEILMTKRGFSEEIILENDKLKAAIEIENKNHDSIAIELSSLTKLTENFGVEKKEKQTMMNIELEKASNEIKIKENEVQSLSQREIDLQQQLNEIKKQNTVVYNEIDGVKEKININKNILDMENNKITIIQTEIEEMIGNHKISLQKINQEMDNVKQEQASITSGRKSIIKETEAANLSIDQLNKKLSHNKLRVEFIKNNASDLNITFDKLNKDKLELTDKMKSLKADLEVLNFKYNSLAESYNSNKVNEDSKLEKLRNDINRYSEEFSSKKEMSFKQIENLKQAHAIDIHLNRSEHKDAMNKYQKVYDDLKYGLQNVTENKMRLEEELLKKTALKDSLYSKYQSLQSYENQLKMEQDDMISHKPIGILKSPSKFVAPAPPKSVTFKPTISWNSTSGTSLESLIEDLNKDSRHTRDKSYVYSQQTQQSASNQPAQNWDNFLKELLYKDSQPGTSEEVHGSYSSSPPVRLTDIMANPSAD